MTDLRSDIVLGMPRESVLRLLRTVRDDQVGGYVATDLDAWSSIDCANCGGQQMLVVAAQVDGNHKIFDDSTLWLRCVGCLRGMLVESGKAYPSTKPLRVPKGLPAIDQRIWEEARECLSVGAYVAAVMLCRKLLFHIAVAHDLAPVDDKGWAPSFAAAAKHLETEGIFTARMRPWVERIKDVGNDANHEVTPVTKDQALDVATFTEQLLILAYELDALMASPSPEDE